MKKLRVMDKGVTRRDVSKHITIIRVIRDQGKQNNSLLNEDLTMQEVDVGIG